MKEKELKQLLDRIEAVLARAGERWLDPKTGDEFIRATWRPQNADTESVAFARRDRDGSILILDAIDIPVCSINAEMQVVPRSLEVLEDIAAWIDELEASLDEQ